MDEVQTGHGMWRCGTDWMLAVKISTTNVQLTSCLYSPYPNSAQYLKSCAVSTPSILPMPSQYTICTAHVQSEYHEQSEYHLLCPWPVSTQYVQRMSHLYIISTIHVQTCPSLQPMSYQYPKSTAHSHVYMQYPSLQAMFRQYPYLHPISRQYPSLQPMSTCPDRTPFLQNMPNVTVCIRSNLTPFL